MQVYLSYAYADRELARRVAAFLLDAGFTVWDAEQQIFPGDNWAEKIGQALKESSAMVVLLTPEALKSVYVRREIDYALSQKAYSHRLITVLADSPISSRRRRSPGF